MSVRFICPEPVKRQNDLKFHSVGAVWSRRQPAPMRFDNRLQIDSPIPIPLAFVVKNG
jgi:hypothetical protein